jgi:hypothetical protein
MFTKNKKDWILLIYDRSTANDCKTARQCIIGDRRYESPEIWAGEAGSRGQGVTPCNFVKLRGNPWLKKSFAGFTSQ